MLKLLSKLESAAAAVKACWSTKPRVGIILGSGLGGLAEEIDAVVRIDYSDIPGFPQVSAIGHRGQLVCGTLESVPVLAFQGRCHLYEGNSAEQASLPVRVMQQLGVEMMIVSNAAGGVNPYYRVGDLMLIDDHINLMFANPLIGINDDRLGPRFPDMSAPYDLNLIEQATEIARLADFKIHRGVYVSMLGPTYETRAEYRMVRSIGGDAVGMSTVPEVLVARHAGIRVLGVSTITNVGSPDAPEETSSHEVVKTAAAAAGRLSTIVRGVVASLA